MIPGGYFTENQHGKVDTGVPKGTAQDLLSSVASFSGAYSRGDFERFAFYRGVLKLFFYAIKPVCGGA